MQHTSAVSGATVPEKLTAPENSELVLCGGWSSAMSAPCVWRPLPQSRRSPRDRYKHACCSWGAELYVLGGRDTRSLRDFWKYSVVRGEWTELSCRGEAAPEELEEHSMVAHEGLLYVFGGMLDSAYTPSRCALWLFDTAQQKWLPGQGKSCPPQAQGPSNRKGHSAVVVGSAMLMYGGFIDIKGSSQEFWSLNLNSWAWSPLTDPHQGSLSPGPRHQHSAVAYQGCMYLFGGLMGLREQRDLWMWSSSSHLWTALRNSSGPPRLMGHSAVAYKDSMLLFGGGESQTFPSSCLWSYSFTTRTWTKMAALPDCSPPGRMHHCLSGLGPGYGPRAEGPTAPPPRPGPLDGRARPFKNRLFPAPLTFLGSDGAIELETFSPERCYRSKTPAPAPPAPAPPPAPPAPSSEEDGRGESRALLTGSSLTFENKAFCRQWSCPVEELLAGEEEEEEGEEEEVGEEVGEGGVSPHLPDLLLLLGGRPYSRQSPISMWQMTLTDS
ncbi:LOW QUALITY PROTEIN: host cell factor 2 [Menidia menidia]